MCAELLSLWQPVPALLPHRPSMVAQLAYHHHHRHHAAALSSSAALPECPRLYPMMVLCGLALSLQQLLGAPPQALPSLHHHTKAVVAVVVAPARPSCLLLWHYGSHSQPRESDGA